MPPVSAPARSPFLKLKGNPVAKTKSKSKAKKPVTDAPQTIATKGGLTASALMKEVIMTMEDDTRISKKQASDFAESFSAVVEKALGEGQPINLFGFVKLVPRMHTKGVRQVNEIFGDPTSKKVTKKYPAKVSLKATVMKKSKEALPTVQKMQKIVG